MISRERAGSALIVVAVVVAGVLGISPAAVARTDPAVTLDQAEAEAGKQITVRLAGWPAGSVLVELCGNQGRRGSIDCLIGSAATATVGRDGAATAAVRVQRPPVGCPCVIRVRPIIGGAVHVVPLVIPGVPVVKPSSADARESTSLAVSHANLSGTWTPGWSLLMFATQRTLIVTVRNASAKSTSEPRLLLTAGRPGRTTVIVQTPQILPLSPGQQRTYRIPVTFGAPVWGRYTVRGELVGADEPVVFYAHTSSYPWAFLASPLLIAAFLIRRSARRQRRRSLIAGTGSP